MIYYVLSVLAVLPIIAYLIPKTFAPSTRIVRWLKRVRYQYEVTFALYMLTPTEQFVLDSVIFLALSLIIIGLILYLPEHLSLITRRALYYFYGSPLYLLPSSAASTLSASTFRSSIGDAIYHAATSNASLSDKLAACGTGVKTALTNTGAPAYEAVKQYVGGIMGHESASAVADAAASSMRDAAALEGMGAVPIVEG